MHLHHGRQDEQGEDRPPQGHGSRGPRVSHRGREGGSPFLLRGGGQTGTRDPRGMVSRPILARGKPVDPLPLDWTGDMGADQWPNHPLRSHDGDRGDDIRDIQGTQGDGRFKRLCATHDCWSRCRWIDPQRMVRRRDHGRAENVQGRGLRRGFHPIRNRLLGHRRDPPSGRRRVLPMGEGACQEGRNVLRGFMRRFD